ncbi:hypothetical protein HU200_054996 [Digitaria exilis]|uniref:Pectin acetylesterase n=1 Tax=Digitaria exilis TaxID=1010633 RepID=A0A835AHX0_9POAL|nr:hypothetical protein HU200_054996 [Digitaria exilis]
MAMATELLSPVLPRRRQPRSFAIAAAAAPMLMLLAVVTFFCSLVAAASSPEIIELTLLAGAREKGAVCLDGSPPGYHLQRGFGSGAHSWLVYLQLWSDFHNWNIVVIRYCDGASFAGDAEGEDLIISTEFVLTEVFFFHRKDLSGQWSLWSLINGIVHLQNVREALPKSCLANKDPTEILILCAAGFRKKLVSELKVAEDKRDWGLFIDSCFTHCQTPFRISWISRISPRLHNKVRFRSLNSTLRKNKYCYFTVSWIDMS